MRNDYANIMLNLDEIGGNGQYTVKDLIEQVRYYKRSWFWNMLSGMADGESDCSYCFDGIAFKAATEDFIELINDDVFEGDVEYDVLAGGSTKPWIFHCRTSITWRKRLPFAGGELIFKTEIIPENVDPCRIIGVMNGTMMEVKMKKNNLRPLAFCTACERSVYEN